MIMMNWCSKLPTYYCAAFNQSVQLKLLRQFTQQQILLWKSSSYAGVYFGAIGAGAAENGSWCKKEIYLPQKLLRLRSSTKTQNFGKANGLGNLI